MVFYNIFKKEKIKEPEKQSKIIIDNREKNSLVIANLMERKAEIEFKQLEIADYIIGETAIERKTYSDFISSMINKRIFQQLEEIKKYPNHFLIIEGEYNRENKNLEKASKGLILHIITNYKTPIIFTKDEEETSEILVILAKKQEKEISLRPSRSFKSLEEQKQFILEGFPGIGPKTAKLLLEKFKTIKSIINTNEEELIKLLGKKYEKFKDIVEN